MDKNSVLQVESSQAEQADGKNMWTQDIVFLNSVKDLPLVDGSLRLDRYVAVTCYAGKMQVEVNTTPYVIRAGEILSFHPNDMISNTMLSPDFEGAVLCLTQKVVTDHFGESNTWEYIFHLMESPVFSVSPESLKMLRIYGGALGAKMQMGQTAYCGEIIRYLIKIMFYEVRENIDKRTFPDLRGLRHGEVLFKQFMELLGDSIVKPRSVVWYAEKLCITPKHLSTVCRQVSGKTAFEWINEYVLVDIRNLLKNSDKSIKEVVDTLNFPNASFFGSYCRKHFGMSPMEYRRYLRKSVVGGE